MKGKTVDTHGRCMLATPLGYYFSLFPAVVLVYKNPIDILDLEIILLYSALYSINLPRGPCSTISSSSTPTPFIVTSTNNAELGQLSLEENP